MICAVVALLGCGRPENGNTEKQPPAVPVEAVEAREDKLPIERSAIGIVEAFSSVQVRPKVQGEILKVHFEDGARVQAGDLLFTIDPREFEAVLKRAEANLAVAEAGARNATEQAERYSTLIRRGVASKEQTAQILTDAESRQSELAARSADVEAARLSLEWTRVVAPVTGRAGAALLKAGNIVQPNGETLVVINQIQPIYVSFALPESSLAEVRDALLTARPPVRAANPANGRVLGTGELTFVDNAVDRTTGMITFKAVFPNENEDLWPGQFVDVSVRIGEARGVVVPSVAIVEGQEGQQVFVVKDGSAELRPVQTGFSTSGQTLVQSGLQAGEVVVTTGQLRLTRGSKVVIKPPADSAGNRTAAAP